MAQSGWYVKLNDWLSQHRHPEHLPNAPETQDTYGTLIPKSGFSSSLDGKESTCNARLSLAFNPSHDNLSLRDKYLLSCVRVNHNSWQTTWTTSQVFFSFISPRFFISLRTLLDFTRIWVSPAAIPKTPKQNSLFLAVSKLITD